jgi:hypothetical protein
MEWMKPREIAKLLGSRGGRARAARLSAEARRRIAVQGGKARTESLKLASRIAETLRYASAVQTLRPPTLVARLSVFSGRLPRVDAEPK